MSTVDDPSLNLSPIIETPQSPPYSHQARKSSISSVSSSHSPRASSRRLPSPSPRISSVDLPDTKAQHRHTQSLLSPQKSLSRDRSLSRPSSRNSLKRSHSPALSLDDPGELPSLRETCSDFLTLYISVAVRNHMSTLKHSIRQQQAQLNNLESIVRVGPRPYAPELLNELNDPVTMSSTSPSSNPHINSAYDALNGINGSGGPPSSFRDVGEGSSSATPAIKIKRRSSYDVLHGIAGPDSSLPLPRRLDSSASDDGIIREGIPTSPSPSSPPGTHYKRNSSPTRTLSRESSFTPPTTTSLLTQTKTAGIPISAVGKRLSLLVMTRPDDVPSLVRQIKRSLRRRSAVYSMPVSLYEGNARALADDGLATRSMSNGLKLAPGDSSTDGSSTLPSPNKRLSFTPGNTTRVLADLQTGVVNARNALEHTKSQLRLSQRTVSQLTRQTEDLKESRERLRLENEGLNNVVARKERLLQEVLERARKAEAEAATMKQQLKTETSSTKKALRDMESALAESTALSSKSEREYITLRDSVKGLTEGWKRDIDRLREEMSKREVRWKADEEKLGKKYKKLVEEVKNAEAKRKEIESLKVEEKEKDSEVEAYWSSQVEKMKAELEESNKKSAAAVKTAETLQEELTRLRRLMRTAGRGSGDVKEDSSIALES